MFSRSKTKRFQDEVSCAPPVGSYNPHEHNAANLVSFQRAQRWKVSKGNASNTATDISAGNNSSTCSSQSFNRSIFPTTQSSSKKKKPALSMNFVDVNNDLDSCRKSLEADVEFQQSKVTNLLEKIKMLELQIDGAKRHSSGLEENNQKLHNLLDELRAEKLALQAKNKQLEEHVLKLNAETKILESSCKNDVESIAVLKQQLSEMEMLHEQKCLEISEKLCASQNLNCDFREQLESIEYAMTENLRDLTVKYESLEHTLENVQADYKGRLERSNSILNKTKEAYENSKIDAETMNKVYTTLKEDYDWVVAGKKLCEDKFAEQSGQLLEKENIINNIKEQLKILEDTNTKVHEELTQTVNSFNGKIDEKTKECIKERQQHDDEKKTLQSTLDEKQQILESLNSLSECLQEQICTMKKENVRLFEKIDKLELELVQHVESIDVLQEQNNRLNYQLSSQESVQEEKDEKFNREKTEMRREFRRIQDEIGRQLIETQIKLTKAEEKSDREIGETKTKELYDELSVWKCKYEELRAKVSPFMTQLDEYEVEKQSLIDENSFTQNEMSKLSEKYAHILGHQNNKQKIHHVRKLKEENLQLKADLMKLKASASKDKIKINLLEDQVKPKKFDATKAFASTNKENVRKPLKPANS